MQQFAIPLLTAIRAYLAANSVTVNEAPPPSTSPPFWIMALPTIAKDGDAMRDRKAVATVTLTYFMDGYQGSLAAMTVMDPVFKLLEKQAFHLTVGIVHCQAMMLWQHTTTGRDPMLGTTTGTLTFAAQLHR